MGAEDNERRGRARARPLETVLATLPRGKKSKIEPGRIQTRTG